MSISRLVHERANFTAHVTTDANVHRPSEKLDLKTSQTCLKKTCSKVLSCRHVTILKYDSTTSFFEGRGILQTFL